MVMLCKNGMLLVTWIVCVPVTPPALVVTLCVVVTLSVTVSVPLAGPVACVPPRLSMKETKPADGEVADVVPCVNVAMPVISSLLLPLLKS